MDSLTSRALRQRMWVWMLCVVELRLNVGAETGTWKMKCMGGPVK